MREFLVAGERSKPLKNSFNSLESSKLSLLSDIFGCWEKNENEFFFLPVIIIAIKDVLFG